MNALTNPLTRWLLARSLESLAPALREIAVIMGTPPAFGGVSPSPEELNAAASTLERTAEALTAAREVIP